jgi:hypothetical protein
VSRDRRAGGSHSARWSRAFAAALLALAIAVASACGGSDSDSANSSQPRGDTRKPPTARSDNFHSPDRFPPASWRPWTGDSPWNQRIPADARLDSRSGEYVKRLLEPGPLEPLVVGKAGTSSDFAHAIYYANSNDPLYRIEGGSRTEPYAIDGKQVRLPKGAKPAAGDDSHLAIVYDGEHWGCYRAQIDESARVIRCEAGRRIPIDGVGLHAADTASRFPSLGGRIRFQELDAGHIDHALFAASNRIAYSWVYPAEKSDGRWEPGEGYPPMGTRFQLDPAYMTDARLATYPPWKRALLRAIRDYGFYLGDSTNRSLKVFPIESGSGYTSFGLADPWVTYAKKHRLPSSFDDNIDRTVYEFDVNSGVDWTKLRAIDPCLAAKDC